MKFLSLIQLGMAGDEDGWMTRKGSVLAGRQVIGTPHWSGTCRVQLAAQHGAVLFKQVILCCVIHCALCSWLSRHFSCCPQENNLRTDYSFSIEILLFRQPSVSHCLLLPCVS